MKKGWKVVGIIVFVALLLGIVFTAVGFMTGADTGRIYSVLDAKYYLTEYIEYINQVAAILSQELGGTAVVVSTP